MSSASPTSTIRDTVEAWLSGVKSRRGRHARISSIAELTRRVEKVGGFLRSSTKSPSKESSSQEMLMPSMCVIGIDMRIMRETSKRSA